MRDWESDSLVQTDKERGHGQVIKVVNFQENQLLQAWQLLAPTSWPPADGLVQQVHDQIGTCHVAVSHQSTILYVFKLTNPEGGG